MTNLGLQELPLTNQGTGTGADAMHMMHVLMDKLQLEGNGRPSYSTYTLVEEGCVCFARTKSKAIVKCNLQNGTS